MIRLNDLIRNETASNYDNGTAQTKNVFVCAPRNV